MNIGREIRTVKIDEQPQSAPEPVEEPEWPKPRKEPVPANE
jgi:hypothetical protein